MGEGYTEHYYLLMLLNGQILFQLHTEPSSPLSYYP